MSQPNGRVLLQQSNQSNVGGLAAANTTSTPAKGHHSKTESIITASIPKTRSQHLAAEAAAASASAAGTTAAPPATPGARLDRNSPGPSHDNVEDSKGSWRSWTRGEGLQPSELEIANLPEVRRKANVCQLCAYQRVVPKPYPQMNRAKLTCSLRPPPRRLPQPLL